jgi:hypothetical protein
MLGKPPHPATLALRSGSIDELRTSLIADLRRMAGARDDRDVMLHLTPYHHAAKRLGASPAALFDGAADESPEAIRDLARRFGRRSDVTLGAMGWHLEEDADGPLYRFAWPRWDPPTRARTDTGGDS